MTANDLRLQRYYRLHARVYDATRWSFLFGREQLLRRVARMRQPKRILEIGCGSGRNLESMCRLFPEAQLTGIDLSSAMLDKAWINLREHAGRVRLINEAYDHPVCGSDQRYDLIVCSYALSMFNPGWERAIESAALDLAPNGVFALVDFHKSRVAWFNQWMGVNHVRMDGHLGMALRRTFNPLVDKVTPAYAGLWEYLTFIGVREL
jgi:S-adenosylmethionine-diacylgycerolhomoserine-N-methlytransferase